MSYDL
jgi:hypothetical protein